MEAVKRLGELWPGALLEVIPQSDNTQWGCADINTRGESILNFIIFNGLNI